MCPNLEVHMAPFKQPSKYTGFLGKFVQTFLGTQDEF